MSQDDENNDVSLSELQLELMRTLWAREEASVAEIAADLAASRDLAHTTVATLLTRLARRGLVESRRDGRQLLYRAAVAEPEVRRSMVGDLLRSVFGGDPKALLAHLVSEREVGSRDLERVRELLARKSEKPR
jgi:BlaI family transcriptional regulator, penicillinase repressor